MTDKTWVHAAIHDDNLVANILLHLKHLSYPPPSSFLQNHLPPSWGLRHPRSKPEKILLTRRSPTTPLSWTGGCGSDGGSEETSQFHHLPPPSDSVRSKVSAASDTPTTSRKRTRRKKSFAELKEEESSLLKEQIHLKQEFTTLQVTLKEQRSINENLKRIKLDLQVESGTKSEAVNSDLEEQTTFLNRTSEAASSSVSRQVKTEDASEHLCPAQAGASPPEPVFMLPDLNMALDEECDIFGMS